MRIMANNWNQALNWMHLSCWGVVMGAGNLVYEQEKISGEISCSLDYTRA